MSYIWMKGKAVPVHTTQAYWDWRYRSTDSWPWV